MKMRFSLSKHLLLPLFFLALAWHAMAVPQPVGTTVRDTILDVPCVVYLPHNYAERVDRSARRGFPVLYLQHGMFGSEDDWTTSGRLVHWMDSLLREEMVEEMIIIMPDNFLGSIPPAERAALMAAPNVDPTGRPFSTERGARHWKKLTREQEQAYEMSGYWEEHFGAFMDEAERRYFIDTRAKHRAIAGLSMGGFHTMHVSHYLVSSFDYIGLFSPVILPRETTDLNGAKSAASSSSSSPQGAASSSSSSPQGAASSKSSPQGAASSSKSSPQGAASPYKTAGFDAQLPYASPAYAHWMEDIRYMGQMPPFYWIGIGRDDFLYDQLQDYRHWLEQNHIEYIYYESTGGHNWTNWQDYLCRFLKGCFTRIW